ncbi:TauD/TfdA family dioxygenase [Streptomyces sp. NPDC004284]|uniref:TauD/TfdA family dioxygenase n=1 Tax=Streptomyces sp. NPDC004284 TaxID=3364695 RepID=UPI00369A6A08
MSPRRWGPTTTGSCGWRRPSRPRWRSLSRPSRGGPCGRTSESRPTRTPASPAASGRTLFHMDLVNTTLPPDHTTLLCVRPDPLGGGTSILSDARAAVARPPKNSRALLAEMAYHYGTFFDLYGVGKEYKPFPILDGSDPGEGFVRFTGKMLKRSQLGQAYADAARELAAELVRGQVSFMLEPGDHLTVNQHRFLHGREALHSGQETVPVADRRLLLQLFLREGRRRLGRAAGRRHRRPTGSRLPEHAA